MRPLSSTLPVVFPKNLTMVELYSPFTLGTKVIKVFHFLPFSPKFFHNLFNRPVLVPFALTTKRLIHSDFLYISRSIFEREMYYNFHGINYLAVKVGVGPMVQVSFL